MHAYAIVTEDSDYFILDVERYIPVSTIKEKGKGKLAMSGFERKEVVEFFGFTGCEHFLSLAASLSGNDYVKNIDYIRTRMPNNVKDAFARVLEVARQYTLAQQGSAAPKPSVWEQLTAVTRLLLPQISQHNLDIVLRSCCMYLLGSGPQGEVFPPVQLTMNERLGRAYGLKYLPELFLQRLKTGMSRDTLQTLMLGVSRLGRILDSSFLDHHVPPVSRRLSVLRRVLYGILCASIDTRQQTPPPGQACMQFEEPPASDREAIYFEEAHHEPGVERAYPLYISTPTTGRLGLQAIAQLTVSDRFEAYMFALGLGASPMFRRIILQKVSSPEIYMHLALRVLLAHRTITYGQAAVVVAHFLMIQSNKFRPMQIAEKDMPRLDMKAVDLGSVYSSAVDQVCQLLELFQPIIPCPIALWLVFNGRLLHMAYAQCSLRIDNDPLAIINSLLTPLGSGYPLVLARILQVLTDGIDVLGKPQPASETPADSMTARRDDDDDDAPPAAASTKEPPPPPSSRPGQPVAKARTLLGLDDEIDAVLGELSLV